MHINFGSFSHFLDFVDGAPVWTGEDHKENGMADWRGTHTWEQAMELAREGWIDGVNLLAGIASQFEMVRGAKAIRSKMHHSIIGFNPDVGAFCSGEPECMFHNEPSIVEAAGRIVKIVVNGTASAGVESHSLIRRGVIICALIDALEFAGYSAEVVLFNSCKDNRGGAERNGFSVPLKLSGEALEMDRLVFAIAHPAMLRRLGFAVWSQNRAFVAAQKVGGGHFGIPCDAEGEEQGDLYINTSHLDNAQSGDIVPWIKAQLAKLGITFEE